MGLVRRSIFILCCVLDLIIFKSEKYCEILPEDEARVFEEIATANEGDFVFEGIPCVQPRTDYAHLAFFLRRVSISHQKRT